MTLQEFFAKNARAAIAFSGGADSSYLLYAAVQCGADVHAYFAKTAFQPQFELDDARRLAEKRRCEADRAGAGRPVLRGCGAQSGEPLLLLQAKYFRKSEARGSRGRVHAHPRRHQRLGRRRGPPRYARPARDGRPAAPLRECGLTKAEIRRLSHEAGLFTWDKPAYACLATRVPTGTRITPELLAATERAEGWLFSQGYTDFRVRLLDGCARLQLTGRSAFPGAGPARRRSSRP